MLVAIVLVKSDFLPRVGRKIGILPPVYRYSSKVPAERLQIFYERVDKNVPEGSVFVIGDSLVHGLCVPALFAREGFPVAVGFGIGGDTLDGITTRLKRLNSKDSASAIVLQGGINDLLNGADDEEFKCRYIAMLNEIPHGVPFIAVMLFPLVESKAGITNSRIAELNKWMTATVAKRPNGAVCDLTCMLADPRNGCLLNNYHIGDGLHLNKKGNDIFLLGLRRCLAEVCNGR